jgi:hypothetical protein
MTKTQATRDIEKALYYHLVKVGTFGVIEVGLDGYIWDPDNYCWNGHEGHGIVDFITVDTYGIIRCYEIKVTLSDFNSKAKKTFVGDYNYFAVPEELAPKIESKVDRHVGIITVEMSGWHQVKFFRKAKRVDPLVSTERVKEVMFRAACREVDSAYKDRWAAEAGVTE